MDSVVLENIVATTSLTEVHPIQIFPNPSTGTIYFKIEKNNWTAINIEVFSVNGKILFQDTLLGQGNPSIDLHAFPPSTYFVRVSSSEFSVVEKLVLME